MCSNQKLTHALPFAFSSRSSADESSESSPETSDSSGTSSTVAARPLPLLLIFFSVGWLFAWPGIVVRSFPVLAAAFALGSSCVWAGVTLFLLGCRGLTLEAVEATKREELALLALLCNFLLSRGLPILISVVVSSPSSMSSSGSGRFMPETSRWAQSYRGYKV